MVCFIGVVLVMFFNVVVFVVFWWEMVVIFWKVFFFLGVFCVELYNGKDVELRLFE